MSQMAPGPCGSARFCSLVQSKRKIKNKKRELFDASLFAFSFFFGFCALVEAFCLAVNRFLLLLFFCALLLALFSSRLPLSLLSFRSVLVSFYLLIVLIYWYFLSPSLLSPLQGPSEPRNLTSPNPRDPLFLFYTSKSANRPNFHGRI